MAAHECNHCGQRIEAGCAHCPYCGTPTPEQRDQQFAPRRARFVALFLALALFSLAMMLWLPRVLRH